MNLRYLRALLAGLAALSFGVPGSVAGGDFGGHDFRRGNDHHHGDRHKSHSRPTGLVKEVLEGTRRFRDVTAAEAEGWMSAGSCVSGPDVGAMGIHYVNEGLLGDGALDPQSPEALIYEPRGDRLKLVGVEFITIAEAWHASNAAPPVLLGQHFNYVGAPNRYGLPAFYELHVWAWKRNDNGMFVDWNPEVSCEEFAP